VGILRPCFHFIHHMRHIGGITGDMLWVVDYGIKTLSAVRWGIMGGIRAHLLRSLAQDSCCEFWTGERE
jgi:hypothetical protein